MNVQVRIPVRMSVAEFLMWEPGDGRTWQLVDGEPQLMAPASVTHGTIQANMAALLSNHLEQTGSRCVVVTAPGVIPHIRPRLNFRIPDLAVTCTRDASQEAALTDPTLVIEILSPSNQAETLANLWAYASTPSVQEILVVRTAAMNVELLRRQPDGTWPQEPLIVTDGDVVLDSIGFRAPLARVYRNTRWQQA